MDLTNKDPIDNSASLKEVDYILSPVAIRDRARDIHALNLRGDGLFHLHEVRLDAVAQYVLDVIKERNPSLQISYHSRWSHFSVGGEKRVDLLKSQFLKTGMGANTAPVQGLPSASVTSSALDWARLQFDLVITSVLLDAGTGPGWKFKDKDGHYYARSEGLAVASFHMFMAGAFSSDKVRPWQADSRALTHITEDHIKNYFQVSVSNPLFGSKGRAELLHRLGKNIEKNDSYFVAPGSTFKRLGYLVDYFLRERPSKVIEAPFILKTLLRAFGEIWPGRIVLNDVNLGDTWLHDKLGTGVKSFVPLHKLSQWLTYSLLEPLEELGFTVTRIDDLTGLAEYRNGGLFLDLDLFSPKDPEAFSRPVHADSKLVIEWRALTIYYLDEVAKKVREKLGFTPEQFPLAKVLEGGTWWAGRKIAQAKRPGGRPPLDLISDGTVF